MVDCYKEDFICLYRSEFERLVNITFNLEGYNLLKNLDFNFTDVYLMNHENICFSFHNINGKEENINFEDIEEFQNYSILQGCFYICDVADILNYLCYKKIIDEGNYLILVV